MKGVRKVGAVWQVRVCRNKVRRSATCTSESEAHALAELWRSMPLDQFIAFQADAADHRGVRLQRGLYWSAYVCRNGVRRSVSCADEAEAVAVAKELRELPIEDFIHGHDEALQTRGVALRSGKYWQAHVRRNGVRRAINCPSKAAAIAKVQELRAMPLDEFRALTTNRKTDPAQL